MATYEVTANTVKQTFATVPLHKKLKPSAFNIDNQHTAELTIYFIDTFTPDVSNGQASPSEQEITRLQVTVPAGLSLSYQKDAMEDMEFIGVASAKASATSTSCVIIPVFSFV